MEFFVGILPKDTFKLLDLFKKLELYVNYDYDDPHGYYTFVVEGNWEQYQILLDDKTIIKSLEHFEE